MKTDALLIWDRVELADLLAEKYADEEDLMEAFPCLEKPGVVEEELLSDFIEQNWMSILHDYDILELEWWAEEKECDEDWEKWKDECALEEHEYAEHRKEEFGWSLIEFILKYRDMDKLDLWWNYKS